MKIIRNDLEAFETWLSKRSFSLPDLNAQVQEIIDAVKVGGDAMLSKYTKVYDDVVSSNFLISDAQRKEGAALIDSKLKEALDLAYERIYDYHSLQVQKNKVISKTHYSLEERILPIEKVGIYVPGGKASYPSTVLMNGIPAKIAGVKKVVMVTPPSQSGTLKPSLLYAAELAGIDEIYALGGAQSIAALAYGTKQIPKVDKIVGPGNIYVSLAKKLVSDQVGIDMIAGPSEVLILADHTSRVDFIAADMIAQAEHDEKASAMVLTADESMIEPLLRTLEEQIKNHPREDIIRKSIEDCGLIAYFQSLDVLYDCCNKIAPEHLEVLTEDPKRDVAYLKNAGAIFLGHYTPEALGDYMAGPNHTLPTHGTSKFSSPLSVDDYIKKTSIVSFDEIGLARLKDHVMCMAEDEGLIGHKLAIEIRRAKNV